MPSGHGKKGHPFWLVDFKGNPSPKKGKNGYHSATSTCGRRPGNALPRRLTPFSLHSFLSSKIKCSCLGTEPKFPRLSTHTFALFFTPSLPHSLHSHSLSLSLSLSVSIYPFLHSLTPSFPYSLDFALHPPHPGALSQHICFCTAPHTATTKVRQGHKSQRVGKVSAVPL